MTRTQRAEKIGMHYQPPQHDGATGYYVMRCTKEQDQPTVKEARP